MENKETIAQKLGITEFPFILETKIGTGKIIYTEKFNGYWEKFVYDNKYNCIYYETSDGYWCKSEYDDKNYEIYYETSKKGIVLDRRNKEENDNEIYYENSLDGIVLDKRNKEKIEMGTIRMPAEFQKTANVSRGRRSCGNSNGCAPPVLCTNRHAIPSVRS